jgi:hypothetical protein
MTIGCGFGAIGTRSTLKLENRNMTSEPEIFDALERIAVKGLRRPFHRHAV